MRSSLGNCLLDQGIDDSLSPTFRVACFKDAVDTES